MNYFNSYRDAILYLGERLLDGGVEVETKNWQSTEVNTSMLELFETPFAVPIMKRIEAALSTWCDLPWANEHFKERISGIPMNPGDSYKIWPYYKEDEKWREDEQFSHTYMERFWPKYAGQNGLIQPSHKTGIRFKYGDLEDVIKLLRRDIHTRQAYLPIWFPEDTGVNHGKRVPCTLGYLFNYRNGFFHISYFIRSCDFIRHFRNDLYLTNELANYVMNHLSRFFLTQYDIQPGFLFFHCTSLHIFKNERYTLEKQLKEFKNGTTENNNI